MRNHGAAVADIGLLLISMADGVRLSSNTVKLFIGFAQICRQTEESIGILESLSKNVLLIIFFNVNCVCFGRNSCCCMFK